MLNLIKGQTVPPALKSVRAEKSQSYVVNVYFLCPQRCSQGVLVSMSQWLKLQPGLQKHQQNPVLTAVLLNVLWHMPGFGACLTLFGPVEAGGHKETGRWLGSSFKLASWPFCVLCSSHKVENRQEPTGSEWKLLLFQYIPVCCSSYWCCNPGVQHRLHLAIVNG